jgi:hypothetical protein
MTHTVITDEELDRLLDSQYNPPTFTAGFTEDDFYNEWKSVQSSIKAALLGLGFKSCNDGGDDYTMADDWGYSRHHEVEIHRERMFEKKLLPTIQELLKAQSEDHEVVVLHDLFLRHEIRPFHIILRRSQILAETDDPKLLKRLGLDA